jgi:hypothetical protein
MRLLSASIAAPHCLELSAAFLGFIERCLGFFLQEAFIFKEQSYSPALMTDEDTQNHLMPNYSERFCQNPAARAVTAPQPCTADERIQTQGYNAKLSAVHG